MVDSGSNNSIAGQNTSWVHTVGHNQELLGAFLVTALGAALRLYHLGANSLNLEEVWSIWMAGKSPDIIVREILLQQGDATPPTYYLFLHVLMQFGQQPFMVRILSVLAGTAIIWLTYRLAVRLFDFRVAIISALLVAVAPFQIQYSQHARAYILSDLWTLFSLYCFAQIIFARPRRRIWFGLVAASVLAIFTFYLTFLMLIYENVVILGLWIGKSIDRRVLRPWFISQGIIALSSTAILYSVINVLSVARPGRGQTWIPRPDVQSLIKSAILFTTGDPSFGPIAFTLERLLSAFIIVGLCILVAAVFVRRACYRKESAEGLRILLLIGAVILPLVLAFVISQVRPIYNDKYFLFVTPPIFLVLSWAITRSRSTVLSAVALILLLGITSRSLFVYYSEPVGEQWREAIEYLRLEYQPTDAVILSPGYYVRPFAYYYYGDFPENATTLARAPAVLVSNGHFNALSGPDDVAAGELDSAPRLWYVSGFAPPEIGLNVWLKLGFEPKDVGQFLGARVSLLQRIAGPPKTKTQE